jgi:prepilin-type N-terminal cleavage/methylation domain-containing protein
MLLSAKMMNTCFNSILIKILAVATDSSRCSQSSRRHKGFSLPEVMIALLLVSLGASVLISAMMTTRTQMAGNARVLAAFRLAVEFSDWVRQGGMKALASDTENPFDLVSQTDAVLACFGQPCSAEAAALFYLHNWRRRLFLKVPNARIVVCEEDTSVSSTSHHWSCGGGDSSFKARVIKIGWPQGGDISDFPPRFVLVLG